MRATRRVVIGPEGARKSGADCELRQRDVVTATERVNVGELGTEGGESSRIDAEGDAKETDVGGASVDGSLSGVQVDGLLVGGEETHGGEVRHEKRGFSKLRVNVLDLVNKEDVIAGHMRVQAAGELGEIKLVEVGGDRLGDGIVGSGFLVDIGTDFGTGRNIDVDTVEGAAEFDGDPGSGGFGGHGERVANELM